MLFQKIGVGPEEKKTEDTVVGVPQGERRRVKRLYVLGVLKRKKNKAEKMGGFKRAMVSNKRGERRNGHCLSKEKRK